MATPNEKNMNEGLEHSTTYYEYLKDRNTMNLNDGVVGSVR